MHFFTISTILAVVLGASASPVEIAERQITTGVLLCTDKDRRGFCLELHLPPTNDCFTLRPEIAGKVSSIYPLFGSSIITIFADAECRGGPQLDVVAPGINNLADYGANDMARGIKANFRR